MNSIFGYNNQNINKNGKVDEGNINCDKINIGCRSCSIKKENHRRNLKIDVNKKLNNLKIVNLNTHSNTIKKDSKSNFMYNNQPDTFSVRLRRNAEAPGERHFCRRRFS